jgi:hypothetical protein
MAQFVRVHQLESFRRAYLARHSPNGVNFRSLSPCRESEWFHR